MTEHRASVAATTLSRRRLLTSAAVAGAGAVLVACGNSGNGGGKPAASSAGSAGAAAKGAPAQPLPKPASFQQSPSFDAQVKAGTIPALADRLPANPYVVPHNWVQRGKYGGLLKSTTNDTTSGALYEYTYGYSFLRYINDGQDIVAGLAESWEVNADATVITFHFRQGLKWSDGQPWTTADVMYWWNDMVLNPNHTDSPPDDVRDGKDKIAKITAPDDMTIVLTFTAPAPVAVDRIAAYVNGSIIGPRWMAPKHYVSKYNPVYNEALKPKGTWQTKHDQLLLWNQNPDCPTMVGYRCSKYSEGRAVYWEANPYYYGVTKDGDQLPYIDKWQWICTVDPQVQKLAMATSKVDYVHTKHWPITLADFSTFKKAEAKGGLKVLTWESGNGTGSLTFFNFDTEDDDLRNLLAERDFRLALSYAFNRPLARKSIYFETGELTTGTLSPKGISFQVNDEAKKVYTQWRDSAITFDPAKAKQLLDGLGVKDTDGDGFREYKNGKKLVLRLDYQADTSQENIDKSAQQKANWEAVGLKTNMNPTAPTTFGDRWGPRPADGLRLLGDRRQPALHLRRLGGAGGELVVGTADRTGICVAHRRSRRGGEAEEHQPLEADAPVRHRGRRIPVGQDVRQAAGHLRRGPHRAGRDEAGQGAVGHLQDPHRRRPVHDRHRGEHPGDRPAIQGSAQRADERQPRAGRLDRPVVPAVAGRL